MNNKIVQAVLERSKGLCELCLSPNMTELHHCISGNGKRKQHESVESVINLCWECHRGTYGVHGREGRALDLKLKKRLQEVYYSQGYTSDDVRVKMGGKLY